MDVLLLSILANRIERVLSRGERTFVLEGAELDWVAEALRARVAIEKIVGEIQKRPRP